MHDNSFNNYIQHFYCFRFNILINILLEAFQHLTIQMLKWQKLNVDIE